MPLTDREKLLTAANEGRAMVTRNVADFTRLTAEFKAAGLPHAGVLIIPPWFGPNEDEAIAEALARYAREHPDGMQPYTIEFLKPAAHTNSA